MAKQRIQVGPLADPVPLTPRAAPVDTFHAPDVKAPRQGPSQMAQLTEALSQFNPHLQALGVDLHREEAANANTAGAEQVRKDARLQNRKGFNDAIKAGLIPEAKSPYFLKGMQEQLGRIESDRFDVALREFYSKSQSQHQADITDFIGGFTSTYLEKHGLEGGAPEFQDVFQNNISASISNLQTQHVQRWQAEQSQIVRDRLYQETSFAADAVGVYRSPEDQARDITARVNTLVTNGLSGTDANATVIDAITEKAREKGDRKVLELLKGVDTGNGALANTKYGREKIKEANDYIDAHLDHAANRDRQVAKQAKEDEAEKITAFVQDRLRNDPWDKSPEMEGALARLNVTDPAAYRTVTSFVDSMRKQDGDADVNENTEQARLVRARVANGEATQADLMQAVSGGVIKNSSYNGLVESLAKAQTLRGPLNNAMLKSQYDRLGAILRNGSGAFTSTGAAIVSGEHQSLLLATMAKMEKDGKDPWEIYKRAGEIVADFQTNIVPSYMQVEKTTRADGKPDTAVADALPMFLSQAELNDAGKQAAVGAGPLFERSKQAKIPLAKLFADEQAKLQNLK